MYWLEGVVGCAWKPPVLRFAVLRRRRESGDLLDRVGDFAELALEPPGERARFEVSLIQFRREAR